VVEVPRPYDESGGRTPLRPGSFVEVEIDGATLSDVVAVPRHAVHEGDTVWVVDDGRLRIREVLVVRSDRNRTLVSAGLDTGDLVISSSLDAVTDGMLVRVAGEGAASTEIERGVG
jgi:multidrug efflux pump subunit AcrA (membrane-fusion protein)